MCDDAMLACDIKFEAKGSELVSKDEVGGFRGNGAISSARAFAFVSKV